MRLATFLPPGSSSARAGEIRDERAWAFADESVGLLDWLADADAAE